MSSGDIAPQPPQLSPERAPELAWVQVKDGVQQRVVGVYLGRLIGADGWGAGYRDSSSTPVPRAGIEFVVAQASHGPTLIKATPLKGHRVEALQRDERTGELTWASAPDWSEDGTVVVAHDNGQWDKVAPADMWASGIFGSEGTRMGIVRVTNTGTGQEQYYGMAANFSGDADGWNVTGALVELAPAGSAQLPGGAAQRPQLPTPGK